VYTTRTSCRVCGGALLPVLDLGEQCLPAWNPAAGMGGLASPLELVRCGHRPCSLVQLRHTTDADLLWKDNPNYGYLSGINQTMRQALASVTAGISSKIELCPGDVVVDIGSNDGTLLRTYPSELNRIGFEPIRRFRAEAQRGGSHIVSDYFDAGLYPPGPQAKAVSAVAMFYDLDDPNSFVEGVLKILCSDGVFVIQLSYLPLMLLQGDFLNICHEHLEYYSLQSLEYLLARHGLRAFDAEINNVNGGSLRLYVDRGLRSPSFMLHALREWEGYLELGFESPYQQFVSNVARTRRQLQRIVEEANEDGKTVYAYAASTKGSVLLQYCAFGPQHIKAVAERNEKKVGKFCAGSDIPVISEGEMREASPDYLLVLAWAFIDEFRQREKAWHDAGGRWIVPLPEVRVE